MDTDREVIDALIRAEARKGIRNLAFVQLILLGAVIGLSVAMGIGQKPVLIYTSVAFVLSSAIETFDKRLLQIRSGKATFPLFPSNAIGKEWRWVSFFYISTLGFLGYLVFLDWKWAIVMYIAVFIAASTTLDWLGFFLVGRFYR